MAGGTNQTKPRGTGMPEGFTGSGQMYGANALEDFYNPTTKQTYTHPQLGANPGEGWMKGKPPPGQEYAQWQDPNAPPKYGGWNPGGGGFGGWNPGGQMGGWNPGGQLSGLLGGGQQAIKYPSMNIPGLIQYHTIDN